MEQKKPGPISVLMKFFGKKPGQPITEFKAEMDKLSEAEKIELAQLAAKELGLSQDEIGFPLL